MMADELTRRSLIVNLLTLLTALPMIPAPEWRKGNREYIVSNEWLVDHTNRVIFDRPYTASSNINCFIEPLRIGDVFEVLPFGRFRLIKAHFDIHAYTIEQVEIY